MAHIEKYKAHSVGHMLAHYRRDPSSLERDNIDPALTHLNSTLSFLENPDPNPNWATIESRIAGVDAAAAAAGKRRTRKDAVVMADLVLTLPEDVLPGDEEEFFEAAFDYFGDAFGRENVLGGFIHRDEIRTVKDPEKGTVKQTGERVRDHIHIPFTPIMNGRFNYKGMVPRAFYKTMHKELGDAVERALGYRPSVTLDSEDKVGKVLSQVKHEDLLEVRDAIVKPAEEEAARARDLAGQWNAYAAQQAQEAQAAQARLEGLRRAEEAEAAEVAGIDRAIEQAGLQPPAETLAESARTLYKARSDGEREEGLGSEIERLRSRISGLERANQQARGRMADLDRALPGLRERCRGLRARFEDAQVRVREAIGRLREVPETVSAWALDIAHKMGKRTYDPRSLEYQIESATRSAAIDRRQRGSVSHGRDWGRGIDR